MYLYFLIVLHLWKVVSLLNSVVITTGMLVWEKVLSARLEVGLQLIKKKKKKANPSFWLLLSTTQAGCCLAIPGVKGHGLTWGLL